MIDNASERLEKLSPIKQALVALEKKQAELDAIKSEPIAIIGMGCRFPDADNPVAYWELLRDGIDATGEVPSERWDIDAWFDPDPDVPGKVYTRQGGFLSGIDQFDPQFFGISPREAVDMDPQQRLLLEVGWEALEDAGQAPGELRNNAVGIFVGVSESEYGMMVFSGRPEDFTAYMGTGAGVCFTAGRLSYVLGLQGPTLALDTACSSSLVSLHLACQSLRSAECKLALAGGVYLNLSPEGTVLLSRLQALSPGGRCKTFDASADGYARGEGCGIVVLKRLSDAISDKNNVLAVIRGSAIIHDGPSSGLTVPNGLSQEKVIRKALQNARITPAEVRYVEAHGTGTSLGDPIEVEALGAVFGENHSPDSSLTIGSVKTNFGHLEAAAGIAGLMKVVLALQHEEIPPHLHFKEPNPHIDWDSLPFRVPVEGESWPRSEKTRIAGVSSFGISGTNAHIVLEEAPAIDHAVADEQPVIDTERPLHLLTLSAKTKEALNEQAVNHENYLKTHSEVPFTDICFTAATGRSHFEHRLALVADSSSDAQEQLRAKNYLVGEISRKTPKIAFLFTGQGSEYPDMGRQLFETQPLFRETIERCGAILRDHNVPLLDLLYPDGSNSELRLSDNMTWLQPVLFSLEYALARLWMSWGVTPDVVMGHSIGEYVAACVADVFSLEDGLKLVANRGRLMQSCPEGRMLAVSISEEKAIEIIAPFGEAVSVAVINAPDSVVLSGKPEAIESILAGLTGNKDIETKLLPIPRASHSPLMEPVLAKFGEVAQSVTYTRPEIPLCSNVTGTIVADEVTTPDYWVAHLRQPVRFAESVKNLYEQGVEAFLEIGPKPALLGMAGRCLPDDAEGIFIPSLREGQEDWRQMLESLGQWHVNGGAVNWRAFDKDYTRNNLQLPTYPFQRQRYWIDKARLARRATQDPSAHPLLGKRLQWPNADNEIRFEGRLDSSAIHWLTHRIYDAIVLTVPAYLEMGLAAGTVLAGEQRAVSLKVEDVTIEQALILSEEVAATVHLVLSPENGKYRFRIFSSSPSSESGISPRKRASTGSWWSDVSDATPHWIHHATGWLTTEPVEGQPNTIDLARLQAECPTRLAVADHYRALREQGLDYGPDFQAIEQLFRGEDMVLGEFKLSAALVGRIDEYQFHPLLLDAGFQLAMLAAESALPDLASSDDETYILASVKELRVYRHGDIRSWCVARITDSHEKGVTCNVDLLDELGVPIAEVRGLVAERVRRETLRRYFQTKSDNFYEIAWRTRGLEIEECIPDAPPGSWLIFADQGGMGEELAERLRAIGNTCVPVYANGASPLQSPDDGKDRRRYVNPADPDDFQRLFAESFQEDTPPLQGVVHLWGLDTPDTFSLTTESLAEAQITGCGSVLHLLQAQIKEGQSARLWLVTRNAVNVGEPQDSLALAQAPLWGMAKAIAVEHPELWGGIIDSPTVDELLAEIAVGIGSGEKEDQVTYRAGERYVPRLVKSNLFGPGDPGSSHPSLQPDHCYLITGGLGSLGLKVAGWMVEQGARHLVLTGRSRPSDEAQALLEQLEGTGAKVLVVSTDISDAGQVRRLLEEIDAKMPPLRGIVHAAGVIADGVLQNQNIERFQQVMAPKVLGTWNLHTLTRDLSLDFFVCFSSTASIFGSPGMGNYVAANIFMDALIHFRRSLGLPGLGINWGLWADSRMGTVFESHHNTTESGIDSIDPEEGVSLLGMLMGQTNAIQVAVSPMNWPRFFKQLPEVPAFLSELSRNISLVVESVPIRHRLEQAAEEEYERILTEFIRTRLAGILGANPAQVDIKQPLNAMGLDSLMTIELRNRIRSELGADMAVAKLMGGATVLDLVGEIDPRRGFNVKPKEVLREGEEEFEV
uniref:Acyl transferase domain-containing protein n=1 Tax=Candidatus Kentrum sp. FW TaxID=2126338 RepID=A0A450TTP6_9GAMM|nr:MAG: Acyl transferase domain-containing protein [Candidatus Kentron sp. FW]